MLYEGIVFLYVCCFDFEDGCDVVIEFVGECCCVLEDGVVRGYVSGFGVFNISFVVVEVLGLVELWLVWVG